MHVSWYNALSVEENTVANVPSLRDTTRIVDKDRDSASQGATHITTYGYSKGVCLVRL